MRKQMQDMLALLEMRSATTIAMQFAIGAAATALILGKKAAYGIAQARFI